MNRYRLLVVWAAMLLLTACGSTSKKVEPEKLQDISQALAIDTLWSKNIGSGTAYKGVKLVPRIDRGRVYVADSEGLVEALNAEDGKPVWSVKTGLALSGGPGTGSGLVLVGSSDGEVIALNENTGTEVWRSQVSSEILSVPAADLGVVVVHTIDGKLFGLNAADGSQRWLYSEPVPILTLHGSSSPVINGSTVYCGFAGGKLVALELSSGVLQWEVTITAPSGRSELERMVDIDGDPLISNGTIYVSTYQGEVAAVSQYSGSLLWRSKLSSYNSVTADWRNLYVSDETDQVWGINPDNGAAMWKQQKLLNRQLSAPAVIDGYVVMGDYEGYLHWLSHSDGKLIARTRLGSDPISAAPVVYNGVVYVLADDGKLAALKPVL